MQDAVQQRQIVAWLRRMMIDLRLESAMWKFVLALRAYDPDQPRVPAGNPDGGQWTSEGTGAGDPGGDARQRLANVIWVCFAGSHSFVTVDHIVTFSVEYECAGGRVFVRTGFGRQFPIIVLDPEGGPK